MFKVRVFANETKRKLLFVVDVSGAQLTEMNLKTEMDGDGFYTTVADLQDALKGC